MHGGTDKPVAYGSRHFNKAELNYSTKEKEAAAMEVSNHLAKEIRNLQCEQPKTAHQAAISTAQYNGLLAAAYLELPSQIDSNRSVSSHTSLHSEKLHLRTSVYKLWESAAYRQLNN
jgi:hypothetical protein